MSIVSPPLIIMFEKNTARILNVKDKITVKVMLTLLPYSIIKTNEKKYE